MVNHLKDVSYLQLFKYYQEIQKEVEEERIIREKTHEFITNVFMTKYGFELIPDDESRKTFVDSYFFALRNPKLEMQFNNLRAYLCAGNLRIVVYNLFKEEGFSEKEFGEKIGFTEGDIVNLTQYGVVCLPLLNAICRHFDILKTSDFIRYVEGR